MQPQTQALRQPPDPVEWIGEHFRIPETPDHKLRLAEYQARCLREASRRDAQGNYIYSIVVWSDIKKSVKSTLAAAVALERAIKTEWFNATIVANDLKQADSRVAFYLRRAIELNPNLKAIATIRNYKVILPNHAFIESVPIDPTGEAGGNADLIIFSELWGAHHEAQKRMWAEATLSPTKFGKSQRWIETYAGYSGESDLLEQLYDQGVRQGQKLWDDLEAYANPTARMFCLWNTTPRLDWQTREYYAQEASVQPENEFRRIHQNEWVSSEQTFVPREWWDACRVAEMKPLDKMTPLVIALDAGVSDDCFAVVAVSKLESGKTQVRYARKWTPPKGAKLDFHEAETELRRLVGLYNVVEIAYDPYQLHDFATRLQNEGLAFFKEFSQGADRLIADKQLYDMIRDRQIEHSGEPDLSDHIQNANAKTEGDKAMRIVKRSDALKIDLCVGLSMANYRMSKLVW